MAYSELRTGPTAIPAYLRFDGVRLNAQLAPMTAEVFLTVAEVFLITSGTVTVEEMAEAYRQRIHSGVCSHFRFIDA